MTRYADQDGSWKTTVWIRERGQFRLMNTITPGSKFQSIPSQDLWRKARQFEVAKELVEGWMSNGGKSTAKFKVVQTNLSHNGAPEVTWMGVGARDPK